MTALPKRRLPSRADEAALSALRTRSPTIAGSTRWTNDGRAETSPGLRRRSGPEVGAPGTTAGMSRRVARVRDTTRVIDISFRGAPRPAGPQPRDGLRRATSIQRRASAGGAPAPRRPAAREPARDRSAVAVLTFVIRA